MENKDMKESIKTNIEQQAEIDIINKNAIIAKINRYELIRYSHILQEIVAVRDIIQTSNKRDEKINEKYSQMMEKLMQEKREVEQNLKLRDEEDLEK